MLPLSTCGPVKTDSISDRYLDPKACPAEVDCEALYQQFQPLVSSLTRRYGTTPQLRQDLRGEIYYRFYRLVAHYDPSRGIPICTYILRMLPQGVFNYVRDCRRTEARLTSVKDEHLERLGIADGPEQECVERLDAERVQSLLPEAIAALPCRQRLVLVGRYYQARSFEELAAELQVKEATVRSLLRNALAGLRKRINLPEER